MPPPVASCPSSTSTDAPSRAKATAAARPFGPDPTTTASRSRSPAVETASEALRIAHRGRAGRDGHERRIAAELRADGVGARRVAAVHAADAVLLEAGVRRSAGAVGRADGELRSAVLSLALEAGNRAPVEDRGERRRVA